MLTFGPNVMFKRAVWSTIAILAILLVFTAGTAQGDGETELVRITNVTETSFTATWVNDAPSSGQIDWGDTTGLGTIVDDTELTNSETHSILIEDDVVPDTQYFLDIISDGVRDDNGGAHYDLTSGPILFDPPSFDTASGRVLESDGVNPASGCLVYTRLVDEDGVQSPGMSQLQSAVTNTQGFWQVNIGAARTDDLSERFSYDTSGGDSLLVEVECGSRGSASETFSTDDDDPTDDVTLALAGADLSVSKVGTPDPVVAGELLTYSITVTNIGPESASNIIVEDELPAGVTFESGDNCAEAGGVVTCLIDALNADDETTIEIVVSVDLTLEQATTLTNVVEVSADEPDDNPDNNEGAAEVLAVPRICGDQNFDGIVNIQDAVINLQIVAEQISPSQAQLVLGNLDNNDQIDLGDTIILMQHLVGIITSITECGIE